MNKIVNIKQSTIDKMVKQLKKENSELYDLLQVMKSKVGKLEYENAKLKKEYEMLEEDYNHQ